MAPTRFASLGEVKEIQYTLTAWNGAACVQDRYRHPIEHRLTLAAAGISRKGKVKLFKVDSLNLVLRRKEFPGAKCLQFIC